jgi:hypothetical protein
VSHTDQTTTETSAPSAADALPEPLVPADEYRHEPDPSVELWNESWYLDAISEDGRLGAYLRYSLYPNEGVAWIWGCVVGEGRDLIAAVHHELPLPDDAASLDLDTPQARLVQRVAAPFGEVTVELETEAVRHARPDGLYDGAAGTPARLGMALTWRPLAGPYPYPGMTRYEVACTVSGHVEVDGERLVLAGDGERDHSWGRRDWWAFPWMWTWGRLDDGTYLHATKPDIPGIDYEPGFALSPDGQLAEVSGFTPAHTLDAHGLPQHTDARLHDLEVRITPLHVSPLRLDAPDGRVTRLVRALCRYEELGGAGRTGLGWTEWNQPQTG